MRASSKASTLAFLLAAAGLLARVPVVSARPNWLIIGSRAVDTLSTILGPSAPPRPKGGPDETPGVPAPSGSPSGPVKPKPEGNNKPEEFSGPVHGTPWGLSPSPNQPAVTDADFDLSKITNVEQKGCAVERSDPTPAFPGEPVFNIRLKDESVPQENRDLGILRTNKEQGSITVEEAFPKFNDQKSGDERVRLWEMQATVAFHKSDMKPSDIKQLRTAMITEDTSKVAIKASRDKLGLKTGERFTVKKDSEGKEKEVFDMNLNQSAFGKNAQAFLANVPIKGKEVKEIRVEDGGLEELTYVFVIG